MESKSLLSVSLSSSPGEVFFAKAPSLSATIAVIFVLVIRSYNCDSVKLASHIRSSALAVHTNIISYTLKVAIITEQELPGSPANMRG